MMTRKFIKFILLIVVLEILLFVNMIKMDELQEAKDHAQAQIWRAEQRTKEQLGNVKALQRQVQQLQKELYDTKALLSKPISTKWRVTKAKATAYSPFENRDGRQAASRGGRLPRTSLGLSPGPGIMAVDPKRIPYGSQLLLIYPNGTMVTGVAGDTGGAIRSAKGIVIDVFKRTYREAIEHGNPSITLLWRPPE